MAAMGRMVGTMTRHGGDEIGLVVTSQNGNCSIEDLTNELRGHDVAIDFSLAGAVLKNVEAALANVPLVEGTTG